MLIRWLNYHLLHDSLAGIQQSISNINQRLNHIMSALSDLTDAVTDLTTASNNYTAAVAAEIAAIQAANQSGANDADIEASVSNLKALTDSFNTATAAAQAAGPAPQP